MNQEDFSLALSPTDSSIVAATFLLSLAASILVFWAARKYLEEYAKKTPTKIDDVIVSILKGPVVFIVIAYIAIYLAGSLIASPSASLLNTLALGYEFVLFLFGTWVVARLFVAIMHRARTQALNTPTKVDDLVVAGVTGTGRILIFLVGLAIALSLLFLAIGLLRISTS